MTTCRKYTEEFISRFVDREVSPADRDAYLIHRNECRICREREAGFRELKRAFQRHTDLRVTHIKNDLPPIPVPVSTPRPGKVPGWMGFKRYAGLKLAALGAAAMIIAAVILPVTHDRPTEPTAIVNSLDTYGSSVMIIETSDTQHTIIWFSET